MLPAAALHGCRIRWHPARSYWQELDLSSNNISRITGLSELKQLKKLILVGNEITKIEGLDGLTLSLIHI